MCRRDAMSKSAVPPTKDALLKSYHKRLKDDINSITSNFTEIIKLCKVEDENQVITSIWITIDVQRRLVFLNLFRYAEPFWQIKTFAKPLCYPKMICGTPLLPSICIYFVEPLCYQYSLKIAWDISTAMKDQAINKVLKFITTN